MIMKECGDALLGTLSRATREWLTVNQSEWRSVADLYHWFRMRGWRWALAWVRMCSCWSTSARILLLGAWSGSGAVSVWRVETREEDSLHLNPSLVTRRTVSPLCSASWVWRDQMREPTSSPLTMVVECWGQQSSSASLTPCPWSQCSPSPSVSSSSSSSAASAPWPWSGDTPAVSPGSNTFHLLTTSGLLWIKYFINCHCLVSGLKGEMSQQNQT